MLNDPVPRVADGGNEEVKFMGTVPVHRSFEEEAAALSSAEARAEEEAIQQHEC